MSGPMSEPISGPISGPMSEPMSGPMSEPMSGPMSGPISEPMSEPMSELMSGPMSGPISEPIPSDEEPSGPPPPRLISWTKAVVLHPAWIYLSAGVTGMNIIALFLNDPCEPERVALLRKMDIYFCAFFLVETLLLVLVQGPRVYLKRHWNKLDLLILLAELLSFPVWIVYRMDCSVVLDPLRPLRLCGRIPFLRQYLRIIGEALPTFGHVTAIFMFIGFICSIISVKLWKGTLHNRCFLSNDSKSFLTLNNIAINPFYANPKTKLYLCSTSKQRGQQCEDLPSFANPNMSCRPDDHWTNLSLLRPDLLTNESCLNLNRLYDTCKRGPSTPYRGVVSFDDIGHALIAIFQVTTLEGWSEVMYFVMDAYSFWSFIFFIVVTVMGSFIMLNVVAVVIATQFSKSMQESPVEPPSYMDTKAKELFHFVRDLPQKLNDNYGHLFENVFCLCCSSSWKKIMAKAASILDSEMFRAVMTVNVTLSILVLAVERHRPPKWLNNVEAFYRTVTNGVFIVELVLCLIAQSYHYLLDFFSFLDCMMTVTSTLEMIYPYTGEVTSLLRSFRVLRLLRIVRSLPYLRKQMDILGKTIREAVPLLMMIVQLVVVFSLLGMQLFGCKFKFLVEGGMWRKNFDHLKWAMVTVFQILTHEDWNYVMYNGMVGVAPTAALYFIILIFLGKNLFLNILVSIVVHNFRVLQSRVRDEREQKIRDQNENPENPDETRNPHDPSGGRGGLHLWLWSCTPQWLQHRWDHSLFIFAPENRFRHLCKTITSSEPFEKFIFILLGLSCIMLALERPNITPRSTERIVLTRFDQAFTGLFLLEMVLKVVSMGLLLGPDSYAHNSWNVFDGVVTLSMIASVTHSNAEKNMIGIFKVLRLLRSMRPLRMLKHVPQLRHAIDTLLAAVRPVLNVVSLSLIIIFMFGVLGVQLWKGAFFNCVDNESHDVRMENITDQASCLRNKFHWERRTFNFDNIFQAMMTLFVMYSKDGWVSIMYDAIDAVGPDIQPVTEANPWRSLYFIFFMTTCYLLLDMFIGTILDAWFERAQAQAQAQQIDRKRISVARHRVRSVRFIYFFEKLTSLVTVGQLFLMSAEHYQQPKALEYAMDGAFYLVALCFLCLLLLKICVLRRSCFKNKWNYLDVVMLLLCIINILLTTPPLKDHLLLDINLLRMLKKVKGYTLIKTIGKTLSKCGSLGLLIIFFFFVYAVLTVELFGELKCADDYPCEGISRYANFRDFLSALLLLFKISTGDNWSGILKDAMRTCRPQDIHCFDYFVWAAPLVFSTFVILVQFILFNLIVAAIMQAMEESRNQEPDPPSVIVPVDDLEAVPAGEPEVEWFEPDAGSMLEPNVPERVDDFP